MLLIHAACLLSRTLAFDEALASSFRRRPESIRRTAGLDPGLRRGDGVGRSKSLRSTVLGLDSGDVGATGGRPIEGEGPSRRTRIAVPAPDADPGSSTMTEKTPVTVSLPDFPTRITNRTLFLGFGICHSSLLRNNHAAAVKVNTAITAIGHVSCQTAEAVKSFMKMPLATMRK
jgi:hypothetical protein